MLIDGILIPEDFTSFPLMSQLLELDLRSCHITSISNGYFDNLPRLDKLFISHNHFVVIQAEALAPLKLLRHLDISYNEILGELATRVDGMIFEESFFTHLNHLMFLDLSHSQLNRRSLRALRLLGPEMKQMSLCHTGITSFEENMLANTTIQVIDLSGNQGLADNLSESDFEHLQESLEIFVFRDADVSDFSLTSSLKKLRMLDFRNNSLSYLWEHDFKKLQDLEILDLGSNNVKNWYERAFTENEKLRILNLRTNNITIMRDGMLHDFYEIR
jgi:Leucine-rich repeat (LRR) protein